MLQFASVEEFVDWYKKQQPKSPGEFRLVDSIGVDLSTPFSRGDDVGPGPLDFGPNAEDTPTPGPLIDLADLANALQPGRKITIAIEAIAYDEEADE